MVDNCCNIKGKLSEVFGDNAKLKLDLFHAIQRIGKKMPKRHPLFSLCMVDLKLVFRKPTDLGHSRSSDTPDAQTILANLNSFTKKWIPCEVGGWKIINEYVLKEINSLKVHITRGCLSEIPVGAGTNRNERLHRHLKPHFSCSRLGLPMALALMTILLYNYNSNLMEKKMGIPPKLLTHETDQYTSLYQFGITAKDPEVNNILPSAETMNSNTSVMDCTFFDKASEMLTLNEIASHIITVEEIMNILEKAIHLFNVAKRIEHQINTLNLQVSIYSLHVLCFQSLF